jgi:hypothetical protein
MSLARKAETSVDNHFTRQYIPEDNSEHHTLRRENLKSHDITRMLIEQRNGVLKIKTLSTVFVEVHIPASPAVIKTL